MFLKLTSQASKNSMLINMEKVVAIHKSKDGSLLECDHEVDYYVDETPDEIGAKLHV